MIILASKPAYLTGLGIDDHRITKNSSIASAKMKPLILAGVTVSKEYSPIAHSDGDVVYHAISNAMFLAVGERDIGYHFPDTDPNYSGIPGKKLLEYALGIVEKAGYSVNNVTVMITAGQPRISPHVESMKKNTAKILKVSPSCIGIGATSGESLSDQVRGKGINVMALVCLKQRSKGK